MTRPWTSTLVRLTLSALAGMLLTYLTGRVALAFNGTCSVLCEPSVAVTLGGLTGIIAFWNVGKERGR